ncbi:MAG: hypothetical protein AAFY59_07310 [Pseudomonadota bacterium]
MRIMIGGWRAERGNRRSGTKAAGYARPRDMRVPESWTDRDGNHTLFYERLSVEREEVVEIGAGRVALLYEKPREGFTYGCGSADVVRMLELASCEGASLPDVVAFRQPTRKQKLLTPVWGRFLYWAEFGQRSGTAIVLEAQRLGDLMRWPRRMSLEDRDEYARLVADGHVFRPERRYFEAKLVEHAVRNTILYRTLLHELGHWAHYRQDVLEDATARDADWDIARQLYFSKPAIERETFAHGFPAKLGGALRDEGAIPFGLLEG